MINVEDSIVINRPVAEVFAFLADQHNTPQWQDGLLEVRRITEGAIGVGTKHTAVRKFLGRKLELTNEYVKYEPNRQITFTGDGSTRFEHSYFTEATSEGTKVTSKMEMEPGGLLGLAEPLIAKSLKKDFRASLILLKSLLEKQTVGVSS